MLPYASLLLSLLCEGATQPVDKPIICVILKYLE